MKLKAGKMGSMKAVKDSLKKGGASGSITYIKNVPSEGITVRFLTEPEDWFGYYEYYDATAKNFVPMTEGEVLPDGSKPSFRYLANALDVSSDRVVPIKLAKTAANVLILKYDKYGTMMDRNYELQKHGEGLDTKYDVTPDAPTRLNLAKYDLLDLEEVLVQARNQATGEQLVSSGASAAAASTDLDDDDDEDVTPAPKKSKGRSASAPVFPESVLYPDGDFRVDYSDKELLALHSRGELVDLAAWWEIEADDDEDVEVLIEAIVGAQNTYANEEAAAEEDEADADDDDTDDEEAADDEESDEEDDEEVVYDEDSLAAMSIRELRLIANDLGIEVPKGTTKQSLVDLIIQHAED